MRIGINVTNRQNVVSQFFHARSDRKKIAAWKLELNRIHRVFTVGPATSISPSVGR